MRGSDCEIRINDETLFSQRTIKVPEPNYFHSLVEFIASIPTIFPFQAADTAAHFYCLCWSSVLLLFGYQLFLYYTSTNEWCCNIIFNSPLLPSLSKHFRLIDSIVFPSFRKFVRVYLVIESLSFNFSHFLHSSTPHNMSYLAHDRGSLKNWRL